MVSLSLTAVRVADETVQNRPSVAVVAIHQLEGAFM
jgi:hypothetical protein